MYAIKDLRDDAVPISYFTVEVHSWLKMRVNICQIGNFLCELFQNAVLIQVAYWLCYQSSTIVEQRRKWLLS